MENQINTNEKPTMLSEQMIYNLRKTVPWMRFFAIFSFIGAGVLIIFAIITLGQTSSFRYRYYYDSSPIIIAALVYIVTGIVMIVAGFYLLKSADGYSRYSIMKDSNSLETAFLIQKKYWQTVGVFSIVMLTLP